jgi:hypothetical protein
MRTIAIANPKAASVKPLRLFLSLPRYVLSTVSESFYVIWTHRLTLLRG